jgi:hypothetical protein
MGDGEVRSNMTPDSVGYIFYTADGHMAYLRMRSKLPPFASGGLHGGSPEEKLAAYDNMNGYCGTYEVKDNTLVHHVEAAALPDSVGTDLVRTFILSGNELRVITSPTLVAGDVQTATLVFRRT